MSRQDPLDKLSKAHDTYVAALARAEEFRKARDRALIEATETGVTRRAAAAALGLTAGRVQQLVERARVEQDG